MQINRKLLELAINAAINAGAETLKFYLQDFEVLVKDDHSPLTLADLESNRVIIEMLKPTNIPILSEENKLIPYEERKDWSRFWLVDPLDGTKEFINKNAEYTVNIALIEDCIPVIGVVFAPALGKLYYGMLGMGSYRVKNKVGKYSKELLDNAKELRLKKPHDELRIIASRSHLSDRTREFIEKLKKKTSIGEIQSFGSSLKLCMIAEGSADVYPRLGPTMEWDTAASHAVAVYAGCEVINFNENEGDVMLYNKEDLHNPGFIVYNKSLDPLIKSIIRKSS